MPTGAGRPRFTVAPPTLAKGLPVDAVTRKVLAAHETVAADHDARLTQAEAGLVSLAELVASLTFTGRLLAAPQIFTATAMYTPTTGTRFSVVTMLGGGGGGGGASGSASTGAAGSGGGSGWLVQFVLILPSAGLLTVGTGGTAGSAGGSGGSGGSTSLVQGANTWTAPGGTGGVTSSASTAGAYYAGGAPSGTPTLPTGGLSGGWRGGHGWAFYNANTGTTWAFAGDGAGTPYGAGGKGANGTAGPGGAAVGHGSGGGGGNSTGTGEAGGAGGTGLAIIQDYS